MSQGSPYRAGPDLSSTLVAAYRTWLVWGILLLVIGVGAFVQARPFHPYWLIPYSPFIVPGIWLCTIQLRVFHDRAKDAFVTVTRRWPLPRSERTTPLAEIAEVILEVGAKGHKAVGFRLRGGETVLITQPESGIGDGKVVKLHATIAAYFAELNATR